MDKLKPCPFCGGEAEINKNPLWRGNRGYKGCYEFVAVCKKCGFRVDHIKNDSIYRSEEEAQENVIKAWNKRVFQAQNVPGTNVGDVISRQAAIDALKRISFSHYFECGEYLSEDAREIEIINSNKALEAIKALPPAQPDRKHGKWIYHIDDIFPAESTMECDQCHAEQPLTCDDEFCPHCGARMEGNK